MKALQAVPVTRNVALGRWTEKATVEARLPIKPFEARDTLALHLAGKIDQWFARSDREGAVFLMNIPDPAEAHALLESSAAGPGDRSAFNICVRGIACSIHNSYYS
jgi:hypothetical protein